MNDDEVGGRKLGHATRWELGTRGENMWREKRAARRLFLLEKALVLSRQSIFFVCSVFALVVVSVACECHNPSGSLVYHHRGGSVVWLSCVGAVSYSLSV